MCSILLYGDNLVTNKNELERIDRTVLQQYLKAIFFSKQDVLQKLTERAVYKDKNIAICDGY